MQTILSVSNLSKNYGSIHALSDLNISVKKGDIYGILGPNGSGKTTTLGIVLGVTNPTKGSYSWFERGISYQLRKRIGCLLDKPNFYPHLNGYDNLKLVADIKQLNDPHINEMLELAGIHNNATRKYYTYSTGMKQRLALAATLLGKPEVLVLDEPTNGLDPEGIADVRELIMKIAREGTTVVMASHLLDEVQKVCSHVTVLKKGKKLFEGHVHALLSGKDGIEVGSDNPSKLASALSTYVGVDEFEKKNDRFIIKLKDGFKSSELSAFLITNGINITHFAQNKGSLEQEFLNLLAENSD